MKPSIHHVDTYSTCLMAAVKYVWAPPLTPMRLPLNFKKEMLLQKMLSTEMPSLFKIVYYFAIAAAEEKCQPTSFINFCLKTVNTDSMLILSSWKSFQYVQFSETSNNICSVFTI